MADKDADKNKKGNHINYRGDNRGSAKKWWVGAIIAVVVLIILLMVLNDRTDYSMDDEPNNQTERDTIVLEEKSGPSRQIATTGFWQE